MSQPDAASIGSQVADYFRMAGVDRTHLLDAREAVDIMSASFTATNDSPMRKGLDSLAPIMSDSCLDWQLRVRSVVASMSEEPILDLFVECLNNLTVEFATSPASAGDWRDGAARHAQTLRDALAGGSPEGAARAAEMLNASLQDRLSKDLSRDDDPLPLPAIDTMRQEDDRTLAILVARKLAAEILHAGKAGQRLGSEWDLCERFSVSRATLRQAICRLEDSGLVECRRGRGNGLVVRDLRGTGGIRLVLAFLISHQMDPRFAGAILFQLNRFVPALAVVRANEEQRTVLKDQLDRVRCSDPIDRYDLLGLVQCVSRLANSPIIDLFSRCLAAYEARFHPFLVERLPVRVQTEYFDLLRLLLDRTKPGDEAQLEWAKQQSSQVMLTMSQTRPI